MKKTNSRMQLRMNGDELASIEKVRKALRAPTNMDAVRKSLRIAEWYIAVRESGATILVEKDGQTKLVEFVL